MDDGWNTIIIVVGTLLACACAWLGWQWRRLQTELAAVNQALEIRTTELESARLELQRLSTEDSLTALANHEQFLEFVEREWRRARRDSTPLSLVFVDVDYFRPFNRQFGRKAGDECLRQIGRAIEGLAGRAGDLVARYHRDEFAIVLSATEQQGALRVAERVRQAVESLDIPPARDSASAVVTVSVAVATATPERQSAWEELDLIKAARQALREARAAGGNRVVTATLAPPVIPHIRLVSGE